MSEIMKKGPVIKEGPYGLFPPYERMLILRGVKEGEWICILDYLVSWEIIYRKKKVSLLFYSNLYSLY